MHDPEREVGSAVRALRAEQAGVSHAVAEQDEILAQHAHERRLVFEGRQICRPAASSGETFAPGRAGAHAREVLVLL